MSNGNGKATILEGLKTVLASQVGGWVIAVAAFGVLSYWIIQDRAVVYSDLNKLRADTLPVIRETKEIADDARNISLDNNRILQEVRSLLNLPIKNQQTLEDIKRRIEERDQP